MAAALSRRELALRLASPMASLNANWVPWSLAKPSVHFKMIFAESLCSRML
jgi:hypothetical protein